MCPTTYPEKFIRDNIIVPFVIIIIIVINSWFGAPPITIERWRITLSSLKVRPQSLDLFISYWPPATCFLQLGHAVWVNAPGISIRSTYVYCPDWRSYHRLHDPQVCWWHYTFWIYQQGRTQCHRSKPYPTFGLVLQQLHECKHQ